MLEFKISDGDHDELARRIYHWLGAHATAYENRAKPGFLFNSSEDLVIAKGVEKRAVIWDMTVEDGEPGKCFETSFVLSQINKGWKYVEGWALLPFMLPTHHAWCVDEAGDVQDATWKPMYRQYRDRDAARGSEQPYSGKAVYFGITVNPILHRQWFIARGHPNILSIRDDDVQDVLQYGVPEALQRVAKRRN